MNKTKLQELGQRLFNRRFYIEEKPQYDKRGKLDQQERDKRRAELSNEMDRLKSDLKKIGPYDELTAELIKAARFVVDVAGDNPSIDELAVALQKSEENQFIRSEIRRLSDEIRKIRQIIRYRYRAGYSNGMFLYVIAEANTLGELEKLIREEAKK